MNKLKVKDLGESSHDHKFTSAKDDEGREIENSPQRERSTSFASLLVQQLQDMITNTIRAQHVGSFTSSLTYSKPYTKCIDNMRMPKWVSKTSTSDSIVTQLNILMETSLQRRISLKNCFCRKECNNMKAYVTIITLLSMKYKATK